MAAPSNKGGQQQGSRQAKGKRKRGGASGRGAARPVRPALSLIPPRVSPRPASTSLLLARASKLLVHEVEGFSAPERLVWTRARALCEGVVAVEVG